MPKHNPQLNTMTVGELKELLEEYGDDTPVVFSYNYGDYWDTTVYGTINSAEEGEAEWSEYHRMFKEANHSNEDDDEEDDEKPDEDEGNPIVLVLR